MKMFFLSKSESEMASVGDVVYDIVKITAAMHVRPHVSVENVSLSSLGRLSTDKLSIFIS